MEVIVIRLLGFTFLTKDEQMKREKEALLHYFRYGAEHRNKVGKLLKELIPGEKREYLIMYYIQIKESMEACGTQNFEEAVKHIKKKSIIISVNDTINRYYKAVMEADAGMQADLALPSADEIRKMVDHNGNV